MPRARTHTPDSPRRRRGQLALIHDAKRRLGLDDETYRDLLENVTGKRSSAEMTADERDAVLRRFRRCGWTPPKGPKKVGSLVRRAVERLKEGGAKPQEAMILGLWEELLRIRARAPGARLEAFMERVGVQVAHPRFATPSQANKVIEGLKAWVKRAKAKGGLD